MVLRLVEGRDDDTLPCVRDARPAHGEARDHHWKLRRVIDELPGDLLLLGRINAHSLAGNCTCVCMYGGGLHTYRTRETNTFRLSCIHKEKDICTFVDSLVSFRAIFLHYSGGIFS